MSKLITPYLDPIMDVGGVKFPVKRGTWDFVEQGRKEDVAQSIISQIGISYSTTVVYILYGCVLSTGGGNTTISSGAIFFNGEIYTCQGNVFTTPSGGNVVVANLTETSWQPIDSNGDTYADPVIFVGTAAPTANVHIIRTCDFASGASGSGTISTTTASNYSNFILYKGYSSIGIVWSSVSAGTWADTGGSTYPTGYKLDGDNTVFLCGGATSSAILGGGSPILTLPLIARPTKDVYVICRATAGGISTGIGFLHIQTTGLVILENTSTASNGSVNLDNVSFRIK